MSKDAIKKVASSSKVLLFVLYACLLTAAKFGSWISPEQWAEMVQNGFQFLIGGYSAVEFGRAIGKGLASGKVTIEEVLTDPKAAIKRVLSDSKQKPSLDDIEKILKGGDVDIAVEILPSGEVRAIHSAKRSGPVSSDVNDSEKDAKEPAT